MRWERRFASPDSKRAYVRGLFSTIADRYDLITVLLSFGQDRRWKRRIAALAPQHPGVRVLDLACGTGDIAFQLASRGARVVGLDITFRMLELAKRKREGPQGRVAFVAADMMALPFSAHRFECVTTGYGLRNVPVLRDADQAIDSDGVSGVKETLGDGALTAKIKSKLAVKKDAPALGVNVTSNKGVVTLNGQVESEAEKKNVEKIARDTEGVKNVVNNLGVAKVW